MSEKIIAECSEEALKEAEDDDSIDYDKVVAQCEELKAQQDIVKAEHGKTETKIDQYSKRLDKDEFENYEIEAEQVHIGSHSITFTAWTWTHEGLGNTNSSSRADPINLVFYDHATQSNIEWALITDQREWIWETRRCGLALGGGYVNTQWVGMTNDESDGLQWVESVALVPRTDWCVSNREHIRLFFFPTSDAHFGRWSVANAHRDNLEMTCGYIGSEYHCTFPLHGPPSDWDGPEANVAQMMRSTGLVHTQRQINCHNRYIDTENEVSPQGTAHDGMCTMMGLRRQPPSE